MVCASPGFLAENGEPGAPADLSTYKCVAFEGAPSQNTWVFGKDHSEATVRIHPRLIVNTAEAAIDAAIAGGGITRVLSYQIAAAVKDRSLTTILREFEPAALPINLVHTSGSRMPLKLRAFLDYAAPRLRQRLGAMTLQDSRVPHRFANIRETSRPAAIAGHRYRLLSAPRQTRFEQVGELDARGLCCLG